MGITKCNTMDAIWRLGSRHVDDSGGEEMPSNLLKLPNKFYLLSTDDM